MSQQPSSLLIGLGDASMVDSLIVDWPAGDTQVLTEILARQSILVREADGINVR